MAMEIPYNLLGLIFGALGVVGLLPLLWMVIWYQLPQSRLKHLDKTLQETASLLESAVQDGFVPSILFVVETRRLLRDYQRVTEHLRTRMFCTAGFKDQFVAAICGLSRRVDNVCKDAKALRARIATASEQERQKAGEREYHEDAANRHIEHVFTSGLLGALVSHPILASPPLTYITHISDPQHQPSRDYAISRTLTAKSDLPSCGKNASLFGSTRSSITDVHNAPLPYSTTTPSPSPRESSSPAPQCPMIVRPDFGRDHIAINFCCPSHEHETCSQQRLTSTSSALDLHSYDLIAELREQITKDVSEKFASSIQSALERTFQGRSRNCTPTGDVEAGLGPHSDASSFHCQRCDSSTADQS